MKDKSFIKLHRKFSNWEWYKDSNTKDLFIHFLLKANWKDGKFEGKEIKRGSLVTSRKQLASELGLSEQSIRTSISKLKSTNEITTTSTSKYTIITIVNYDKYQQLDEFLTNTLTNILTNEQPTTNQQLTTIEEYKNNKNIFNNNTSTTNKNIYAFVENEFGRTLSPVEYEILMNWETEYGTDKIILAFKEAVINGVRNFKYTQKILDAWKNLTIEQIEKSTEETKEIKKIEVFDYDWLNDMED